MTKKILDYNDKAYYLMVRFFLVQKMKKIYFLMLLLCSNFAVAELVSADLLCKGIDKNANDKAVMERIKIEGNALSHPVHGNHFLNVSDATVSLLEMETNEKIGLSIVLNRYNGDLEIIRGWGNPYHFVGTCAVIRKF